MEHGITTDLGEVDGDIVPQCQRRLSVLSTAEMRFKTFWRRPGYPPCGNPFRQCFEFCVSVLCLEFKKNFFSISKDAYLFVLQYHVVSL